MTSLRQIEANRRNALRSTGPTTPQGKLRSRCNAVRHGLTAETVIGTLEDEADYQAFELAVTCGYDARSAVERELVLRLASLLWRLRRATAIETALFEIAEAADSKAERPSHPAPLIQQFGFTAQCKRTHDIARCFLRVLELPDGAFPLLNRYEHTLWRQARQLVLTLESLRRRQYASRQRLRPAFADNSEGSREDC